MIALRLNFTDVVRDGSLRHIWVNGKKAGCCFDVRLSYYRGMFLSAVNYLKVRIDGEEISSRNIIFSLKGQKYGLAQLQNLGTVFWPVIEPATIEVFRPGGFECGEHDIDFIMEFRSPYMQIGPDAYMPNDGSGSKRLWLR